MPFILSAVPDAATLSAFLLASLVLTLTPGPDMALFLGQAVRSGRAAGMASMLGAMTGVVVHTLLAALGISALLAASPTAFLLLKLVGALYLLWLAYEAVAHGSGLRIAPGGETVRPRLGRAYAKGLAINLANPKIVLFFVTFLPQFVAVDDPAATGKLAFLGLAFVGLALPITSLMILFAARVVPALSRRPRVSRAIDWLFAGMMGGFAARLLWRQA